MFVSGPACLCNRSRARHAPRVEKPWWEMEERAREQGCCPSPARVGTLGQLGHLTQRSQVRELAENYKNFMFFNEIQGLGVPLGY